MTTSSAAPDGAPRIRLSSPADLIAATPYLLGFHPDDSMVTIALRGRAVVFAARADLPDPAGPVAGGAEAMASALVDAARRQRPTALAIIGYGPDRRAGPAVDAVRSAARRRGLPVREALRVHEGRWWSYLCQEPRCCPAGGTPFDPLASAVAAQFTVAGSPVLPDRRALARQVAPLEGSARAAMAHATDRAWRELHDRLGGLTDARAAEVVIAEGREAVTHAIDTYGSGRRLADDGVARLTVLLHALPVRDTAWSAITSDQPHLRLWADITRRAEARFVPAPASLLAFAAWRAGNGALASVALERALAADPSYSMARLLRHGLQHGLPPSALEGWGAPAGEARGQRQHRAGRAAGRPRRPGAPPAASGRRPGRGEGGRPPPQAAGGGDSASRCSPA